MKSLNLEILPPGAQKELKDFYDFLVSKYSRNTRKKSGKKSTRPQGLAKGEFVVPDDFNEPLPEEILNQFYK